MPHLMKGEFSSNVGGGIDTFSQRESIGVVGGITPFNFPVMVPLWMGVMAIACGNSYINKPSERDPSAPLFLGELWKEAGLPDGVWNVVNGDKVAVDALLQHPDVSAISFVGSTLVGEYIYHEGVANNKRVQVFGGAKNHMVIMPDADLDQTVDALMGSAYGSAGQRCMAISVAVSVGEDTADRLMEKLASVSPSIHRDRTPSLSSPPTNTLANRRPALVSIDVGIAKRLADVHRWFVFEPLFFR